MNKSLLCIFLLIAITLADNSLSQNYPVRPDPLIQQLLATVDPDSCARTLRDLCGFFNRYARDDYNIEEVVPYLEKKFQDYKCDSVFRLPVSGFDAPAVVGVRWGK